MLDILCCPTAQHPSPNLTNAEFLRIELAPLADGNIFVSLTATTVDSEEPQLLEQEIATDRVATIDELLALIKARVRVVSHAQSRKEN